MKYEGVNYLIARPPLIFGKETPPGLLKTENIIGSSLNILTIWKLQWIVVLLLSVLSMTWKKKDVTSLSSMSWLVLANHWPNNLQHTQTIVVDCTYYHILTLIHIHHERLIQLPSWNTRRIRLCCWTSNESIVIRESNLPLLPTKGLMPDPHLFLELT